MNLQKHVAIVTGGAQGIGKAIVRKFLMQQTAVLIADIDPEAGEEIIAEYRSLGQLIFVETDVSEADSVKFMIQTALNQFSRLDVLVNNAGISHSLPLNDMPLVEWQRVLDINLTGPFLCAKYAAPYLKESRGTIINIVSTRALMSEPDTEAYSASKGGLLALTHALALSLGPDVRVNAISPGWIEVRDWQKSSQRQRPLHTPVDNHQHPVGRVGKPDDIAALVTYLASPQAEFITGANFIVDGGMTRKMTYM